MSSCRACHGTGRSELGPSGATYSGPCPSCSGSPGALVDHLIATIADALLAWDGRFVNEAAADITALVLGDPFLTIGVARNRPAVKP